MDKKFNIKDQLAGIAALVAAIVAIGGGFGGKDLWFSAFDDKSELWGEPQNLGGEINSSDDEMFPSFRADGSLYFSSDRPGGLGGFDFCFVEAREGVMAFSEVKHLPYPLNSSGDEVGIIYKKQTNSETFVN